MEDKSLNQLYDSFLGEDVIDEIKKAFLFLIIICFKLIGIIILSLYCYFNTEINSSNAVIGMTLYCTTLICILLLALDRKIKFSWAFKANVNTINRDAIDKFLKGLPQYDFLHLGPQLLDLKNKRGFFVIDDFVKVKKYVLAELSTNKNALIDKVYLDLISDIDQVLKNETANI